MERHQGDAVRTPMVNQEQNAAIAGDRARQKFISAVQPGEVDDKKVDPRQRKKDFQKKKDRRKKPLPIASSGKAADGGYFLDVNA